MTEDKIVDPNSLSKEFQKAFSLIQKYKGELQSLECELHTSAPLLHTNFVGSSREPVGKHNLPRKMHFDWGQSCSKVTAFLDQGTTVTFRKLNTRKTLNIKAPSYKVWVYEIEQAPKPPYYFVWCEKGEEVNLELNKGIKTEIGYIFPSMLSLCDFSFLTPFVDRSLAIEFGWING